LLRHQKLESVRTMLQKNQEHVLNAYAMSPKDISALVGQLSEEFAISVYADDVSPACMRDSSLTLS
jgi:hypothetical protein